MAIDEFDTPPRLAAELVRIAGVLCKNEPRVVADFAVGTGELLTAAKRCWPRAQAFGCDISEDRINGLSRCKPDWTVVQCDFLDCLRRSAVPDLEKLRSKVDLVVLNPPFSVRGGTKVDALVDGATVRCSPAMAFVLFATQYLSRDGCLVVLLPAGALESDRDRDARETLIRLGEFGSIDGTTERFPGGNPRVTIAYFIPKPNPGIPRRVIRDRVNYKPAKHRIAETTTSPGLRNSGNETGQRAFSRSQRSGTIKLLRGTLQNQVVRSDEPGSFPLVHSTELQGYTLRSSPNTVPAETRSLRGPAVLIHRVGKPRQDKVVFVPNGPPFAITDCVVAMLSGNREECRQLQRSLTEQFGLLERNYVGSGAPYITLARIQRVLEILGFASEITNWHMAARIFDTVQEGITCNQTTSSVSKKPA